ncbi:MAG: SEC-C domain-containing protein [Chlamydiia bacterium]|nr:SEC-C domain-containing protein [Chlamydiia bacterium]
MEIVSRNSLCFCSSGKKYKQCYFFVIFTILFQKILSTQ